MSDAIVGEVVQTSFTFRSELRSPTSIDPERLTSMVQTVVKIVNGAQVCRQIFMELFEEVSMEFLQG